MRQMPLFQVTIGLHTLVLPVNMLTDVLMTRVSAETRAVFEWLLDKCEEVDTGQRAASTGCTEYKWSGKWQLLES